MPSFCTGNLNEQMHVIWHNHVFQNRNAGGMGIHILDRLIDVVSNLRKGGLGEGAETLPYVVWNIAQQFFLVFGADGNKIATVPAVIVVAQTGWFSMGMIVHKSLCMSRL